MRNTSQDLDDQVQELTTLGQLTDVYGDVALTRMAGIRQTVLFARQFLDELTQVFADVQAAYLAQLKASGIKVTKKRVTVLSHNGLTVAVLVSANTRLYGDLIQRTFDQFISECKHGNVEATIVGKVGATLYKEVMGEKSQYTYFDFPDEKIDTLALGEITKHLVQYEEIHVFYGTYKNVVVQEPKRLVLSAQRPMGEAGLSSKRRYLFEPSLEAVMRFFESEIFGTLMDQAMRESQLAKFAARLTAMDRASQEIDKRLEQLNRDRNLVTHWESNRKLLNSMPALIKSIQAQAQGFEGGLIHGC